MEWLKENTSIFTIPIVEELLFVQQIFDVSYFNQLVSRRVILNVTVDGPLPHNIHIEGELIFPVSLHLLTIAGNDLNNIQEVWSILPALAQCRNYIKELGAKSRQFDSTSAAVETLKRQQRHDVAAIASESAARVFDLHITKRNIQDNLENHTRFVIVNRGDSTTSNLHKTILVVTPCEDCPGVRTTILNVFSALSINLLGLNLAQQRRNWERIVFFLKLKLVYLKQE
ncbi:prephenate dehydratase domain-containing protein [Aneurinibacillus tyrosinisolvens]|uniref:prephenate dehydratase domain-containing protein n=1 Tax=Aneurinibacillus tyrosinisolvens TaxID=1443435 RepID=UPI00069BAA50|nr:prephenate dehydratase domain-containing protein [Aneurinibacillus tyrosinisolvens]